MRKLYSLKKQNRGQGVVRSKKNALPANTKIIRGEDIFFGSILHLIKKYPSPRFRINPYIKIDLDTGKFLIPEHDRRTIDKLDTMLSSTFMSDEVDEIIDMTDVE